MCHNARLQQKLVHSNMRLMSGSTASAALADVHVWQSTIPRQCTQKNTSASNLSERVNFTQLNLQHNKTALAVLGQQVERLDNAVVLIVKLLRRSKCELWGTTSAHVLNHSTNLPGCTNCLAKITLLKRVCYIFQMVNGQKHLKKHTNIF